MREINEFEPSGADGHGGGDSTPQEFIKHSATDDSYPPQMSQEDYERYMGCVPQDKAIIISNDDWKKSLITIKKKDKATGEEYEVVEKSSQNNIYLMTRYHERVRGLFILNEFSRRKMVVKCPPWEKEDKFRPRDVRDDDYTRIAMELEQEGMKPSQDKVSGAIESICHDRSFHPAQKYFQKLVWDKTPRLDKWLSYYIGAEQDNVEYLSGIGKKWLVAGVARIFKAGCKFDHMLVLEGKTDIGKSLALRKLATFNGEEYFYDGMTFDSIGNKDTMQNIQGNLIIEFPEMSNLSGRDVAEVKQWITIQEDKGRKPYGREPVIYPRQFILAGSTNEYEYLKDMTGNKRFWPVKCGNRIDFEALVKDRDQLWAEAVHLFQNDYPWWIPEGDPLFELCSKAQEQRMMSHIWDEIVIDYCDRAGFNSVSISDILRDALKIESGKFKRSDEMAVAGILKRHGFEKKLTRKNNKWERISNET